MRKPDFYCVLPDGRYVPMRVGSSVNLLQFIPFLDSKLREDGFIVSYSWDAPQGAVVVDRETLDRERAA